MIQSDDFLWIYTRENGANENIVESTAFKSHPNSTLLVARLSNGHGQYMQCVKPI